MPKNFDDVARAVSNMEQDKAEFFRLHRLIQGGEMGHDSLSIIDEADGAYSRWRAAAYELREIRVRNA